MKNFNRKKTLIARKLRELRTERGWSQATYAANSKISLDTIKRIESGKTLKPDSATIARICEDFSVEPTALISEHSYSNYHIVRGNEAKLDELESRFGPAGRQGFQIGDYVTTWLQFDTCEGARYEPELIDGTVLDEDLQLPAAFELLRDQLLRENDEREQRGQKSFYNGPTLCLTRVLISSTNDAEEKSKLRLFFKRSQYANNKAAKSANGAPFRYEALKEWHFLSPPIEFLSSGVGVAMMLFTDGGKRALFSKRSGYEEFRSGDHDVAVVEGIHPQKDILKETGAIDIYGAARRGAKEECGLELEQNDLNLIGFGNDLEYYQWNVIGYATTGLSSNDVIKHWHGAADRKESEDLFSISSEPTSVLSFCRDNAIWGSGLAAAYFSLCKVHGQSKVIDAANRVFAA